MTQEELYVSVGGKYSAPVVARGVMSVQEAYWNFGWIAPEQRTDHTNLHVSQINSNLAQFNITGKSREGESKVCLFDVWKHPKVIAALGYPYEGTHQLTGSCLPAGSPVRMADGREKPIESVVAGDHVITHTGRRRRVVQTMARDFSGEMVTLHVSGFPFPLTVTADHQIALSVSWHDEPHWKRADEVEEGDRVLIGWDRTETDKASLDLAELLGDRVIILDELMKDGAYSQGGEPDVPISNVCMARHIVNRSGIDWHGKIKLVRGRSENAMPRHIPICPSLARFIGLYLAEGGCDEGKIVFTFSADEEALCGEVLALARGLFGAEGKTFVSNERGTSRKVTFSNSTLSAVLKELVPGNVYDKRVPGIFFAADEETRLALLLGWMAGDGYVGVKGGKRPGEVRITGVTVSTGLARDMTTLALSCGLRATCNKRKARKQSREAYDVHLTGKKAVSLFPAVAARASSPSYRQTDPAHTPFGYARAVRRVEWETVERLPVYDFEVEEDHSFIAGGLAVHNCVGAGGGNVAFTLSAIEVIRLNDPEKIILPFYPYTYGRSRYRSGMRGRGEGSTGAGWAEAAVKDGILDNLSLDVPKPKNSDALVWGESVEMEWSAGDREPCTKWLDIGTKHIIKTASRLKSADEVRSAIANLYPVTCASMYGFNPVVRDGVLLGVKGPRWSHQMSIHAYWDHPALGTLFWLQNQWGKNAHGTDPAGGPLGGVWITSKDVDWICQDEVFAFSQFDGYPAPDWEVEWIFRAA